MDNMILIPTAILGFAIILIHAYRSYKNKKEFRQRVITSSILNASGIVCGLLLALCTFLPHLKSHLANLDLYELIAGLVVSGVSIQSIVNDFKND